MEINHMLSFEVRTWKILAVALHPHPTEIWDIPTSHVNQPIQWLLHPVCSKYRWRLTDWLIKDLILTLRLLFLAKSQLFHCLLWWALPFPSLDHWIIKVNIQQNSRKCQLSLTDHDPRTFRVSVIINTVYCDWPLCSLRDWWIPSAAWAWLACGRDHPPWRLGAGGWPAETPLSELLLCLHEQRRVSVKAHAAMCSFFIGV